MGKGFAHRPGGHQIGVIHGIEHQGTQLGRIHLSLGEYAFISAYIHDFTHQPFVFFIIALHPAFQHHGQLCDDGGIHPAGFFHMEPGPGHFVRHLVAGYHAHIITGGQLGLRSHADRKSPGFLQVGYGFVGPGQAEGNLRIIADTAPGCIHHIRYPVFIIGPDHIHRLRIGHRSGTKIFPHCYHAPYRFFYFHYTKSCQPRRRSSHRK